jgi:hypothetical protein
VSGKGIAVFLRRRSEESSVDRRKFHKAALAGAAAGLVGAAKQPPAAPPASSAPPLPHPGDALPAGATVRLGTNRFWHLAERGNEGLNDLAFAPDGRTLAALGYQDGCISLWEVPSPAPCSASGRATTPTAAAR